MGRGGKRVRPGYVPQRDSEEAFWAKVDRTGGEDACWPVVGLRPMWNQYFSTRYRSNKKRTMHRIAWEIANGEIDESNGRMTVMHDCPGGENRACVNPRHLKIGTYSQNTQDMVAKGRAGTVKSKRLTKEQVATMRAEYAAGGVTMVQLAAKYGIHAQNISLALKGRTYGGKRDETDRRVSRPRATEPARA